jgi:ABC-type methionine transport system ATPase subunit
MSALLQIDRASFHEPGHGAVNGVSLSVEAGQIVAVIGRGGSGKTTLLRGALGLVDPDEGSVTLLGKPLNSLNHDELLALLGRCALASSSAPLLSNQSLAHNVAVPLWMRGVDPDDARTRVDELFSKLGLSEVGNRRPDDVLPRDRDLALLARALAQPAELLVLDDPPKSAVSLIQERANAGAGVLVAVRDGNMFPQAAARIDL